MRVVADLTFGVEEVDGARRHQGPGRVTTGTVTADGSSVLVQLSRTPSLLGSSTRPLVRPLADGLDHHGLTVSLVGPDGPLVELGHRVRAPWWQIVLTRSRRIRLVSLRRVVASRGGPRLFEAALPPELVLPTTALVDTRARRTSLLLREVARRLLGRRR